MPPEKSTHTVPFSRIGSGEKGGDAYGKRDPCNPRLHRAGGAPHRRGLRVRGEKGRGPSAGPAHRPGQRPGGDTAAYSIETPEPEQSQSPGDPAPYALVDLWVDRQGFQLLVVEDVPIFPGFTSVQDLPLVPMRSDGGRGGESVEIPPQDL